MPWTSSDPILAEQVRRAAAIRAAYLAWRARRPWRWAPERLHAALFARFGQADAARELSRSTEAVHVA